MLRIPIITIELEQNLRLINSAKFSKKNFYKHFDRYKNENQLIEEKQFMLEYDDENIEIAYTKWLMVYLLRGFVLVILAMALFYLNTWFSLGIFILVLFMHKLSMYLKNQYVLFQLSKDFTIAIYDNKLAEAYNMV